MMRELGLLRDERGARSSMRVLLFVVVVPVMVLMTAAELLGHQLQSTVWTVWSSMAGMLIVGSFGPRIAQYIGPQLGAVAGAVGQAKRDPRLPSKYDDEREGGEK
jgi:hypothetical protein